MKKHALSCTFKIKVFERAARGCISRPMNQADDGKELLSGEPMHKWPGRCSLIGLHSLCAQSKQEGSQKSVLPFWKGLQDPDGLEALYGGRMDGWRIYMGTNLRESQFGGEFRDEQTSNCRQWGVRKSGMNRQADWQLSKLLHYPCTAKAKHFFFFYKFQNHFIGYFSGRKAATDKKNALSVLHDGFIVSLFLAPG